MGRPWRRGNLYVSVNDGRPPLLICCLAAWWIVAGARCRGVVLTWPLHRALFACLLSQSFGSNIKYLPGKRLLTECQWTWSIAAYRIAGSSSSQLKLLTQCGQGSFVHSVCGIFVLRPPVEKPENCLCIYHGRQSGANLSKKLKSQGYQEPCSNCVGSSSSSNNKNANHSWWQKAHNKLPNKGESKSTVGKKQKSPEASQKVSVYWILAFDLQNGTTSLDLALLVNKSYFPAHSLPKVYTTEYLFECPAADVVQEYFDGEFGRACWSTKYKKSFNLA